MPTVPSVDEETVCEVNRDFLTVKAGGDDALPVAQERYGRILGRVFPKVSLFSKAKSRLWSTGPENAAVEPEEIVPEAVQPSILQKLEEFLFRKRPLASSKAVQSRGISWHRQKLYLALVVPGSAEPRVFVVDYEEPDVKEPYLLSHDLQQNARAVEWRPNSGSMLAVGCRGGICLWMYSARPATLSTLGGSSPPRAGTRWTQVDFLGCGDDNISSLSWSPCGKLLACGSLDNATFSIWDVSIGESTPLRRGLAGVQFLKWSPLGDYLLSAKVDSSFYLWETSTWTSEPWTASGGTIVNAAWSPEGRMLLCGFDQSTTLGTLHFAGKPPSLEIHLLPLELRDIETVAGPGGAIEMIAWDGTGERLAVSYSEGDSMYAGLVAVFDTRRTPIMSASLLGFIRGPGQAVKPLSFGFLDKLRQGALLAVYWSSGTLCVYPLLFRTH